MIYRLEFLPKARKDWDGLEKSTQDQLKRKLRERLAGPRVPKDALHGLRNCYKIKLRTSGQRLVYRVSDALILVTVVAVGRRDDNEVYETAKQRLDDLD
jgi:mRNA interferase RelE/StbE